MNTTGMTEMGNENNLPQRKGFFERVKYGFSPLSSYWRENLKKERTRVKPNMNSIASHKNKYTIKTNNRKWRNFTGRPYASDTNTYILKDSVAGSIITALEELSNLRYFEKFKNKKEYEQKIKEQLRKYETARFFAQRKIFYYLNRYANFQGQTFISMVEELLYNVYKEMERRDSDTNQRVIRQLQKTTGPTSFWGNILPANEEELKAMSEFFAPDKNIYGQVASNSSITLDPMKKETNPMFDAPDPSSLPSPNFSESVLVKGGRRRMTRRRLSKKSKTRKH